MATTKSKSVDSPPRKKPKKQAVVVVHGMGEHRPMGTIKKFVEAAWNHDLSLTRDLRHNHARGKDPETGKEVNLHWAVPDHRTGSSELRRITTPGNSAGIRTDFYEFYWADIMTGNRFSQVAALVRRMLLRRWSDVPKNVRSLYVLYWAVVLLLTFPVLASLYLAFSQGHPEWFLFWTALSVTVFFLINSLVVPVIGDVARYSISSAETVGKRREVRLRGLELLSSLNDDPAYDRIILVGHSLGSVIAYDLLNLLWFDCRPERDNLPGKAAIKALNKLDKFIGLPHWDEETQEKFRTAQGELFEALRAPAKGIKPWKISDFITLGSPLTHANFLLSFNEKEFEKAKLERFYSLCPPAPDRPGGTSFLYGAKGSPRKYAHHAASFAATRWTNIYDPEFRVFHGDFISGPLREKFGPGIKDIAIKMRWPGGSRLVTHTLYWDLAAQSTAVSEVTSSDDTEIPPHIVALRQALDLAGR